MAEQTAVKWLQMKLATSSPQEIIENINIWFREAKEMEKEQISKGYMAGLVDGMNQQPREYYNETYKK